MARKNKKKSIVRKIIKLLIAIVLLGVLGILAYYVALPMLKASVTTTYDTYSATMGTISNSLSFSGSVSVVSSEYLTAPAHGTIRDIYVKSGDNVKKGDRLIRLSTGDTVKANFDGMIENIHLTAGAYVQSGDRAFSLKTQRIYAQLDGTVRGLNAEENSALSQEAFVLEPKEKI